MPNIALPYKIILGEATEEMNHIPTSSIDLLLTDPPFNHETENYDTRDDRFKGTFKSLADFAVMHHFFSDFAQEAGRVVKRHGRALVFSDCYSYPLFYFVFRPKFDHVRALIWQKGENYFSLGSNQAFRYCYEMITHAFNKESWFDKKQRQDVFTYKPVPSNQRVHPAQKPVSLLSFLIKATCPPGGTVLDPFGGSGSVLEACLLSNRKCITIEANECLINIINERAKMANTNVLKMTCDELEQSPTTRLNGRSSTSWATIASTKSERHQTSLDRVLSDLVS